LLKPGLHFLVSGSCRQFMVCRAVASKEYLRRHIAIGARELNLASRKRDQSKTAKGWRAL
jgi:hypothetical protein